MSSNALRGNTTKRESLRAQAFRMYGKTCNYCGDIGLEVDHVIELAAGGENSIENLQILCKSCHKAKTIKFNTKRFKGTRGVFCEPTAPRHLSMLFLSPTLVSSPPMAERKLS
jgi:5-methylcytosine-specific restriction endonuclease McrA